MRYKYEGYLASKFPFRKTQEKFRGNSEYSEETEEVLELAMNFEIPFLTPFGSARAQILIKGTPNQTLCHGSETGTPFMLIDLSFLMWHSLKKCPILLCNLEILILSGT